MATTKIPLELSTYAPDADGATLELQTTDTTVTDGSVLGKIEFKAPKEASGTDALLVGASIEAVAEGTFAADNNATELVFKTGASEAAAQKMVLTSAGRLGIGTASPDGMLHTFTSDASITPDADADDLIIEGNGATGITIGSSASSVGSIRFADSGSPRAGLIYYDHVGNSMRFYTSATERVRVLGNNLFLNGGTDARIQLGSGGAGANSTSNDTVHIRGDGDDMKLMAAADGNYIFENNGTEVVRITANAGVGISQDDPDSFHDSADDLVIGNSSGNRGMTIRSASNGEGVIFFAKGTGTSGYRGRIEYSHSADTLKLGAGAGTQVIIHSSGYMKIKDSGNDHYGLVLEADNNDAWIRMGHNGVDGRIHTTYASSAGATPLKLGVHGNQDAITIDTSGNVGIGTANVPANLSENGFYVYDGGLNTYHVRDNTTGSTYHVYDRSASAYKFYVTYTGVVKAVTTNISGISDERLKENIKDLDQGLADVLKLKPRKFDWKEGEGSGATNVSGFVAQEAETAGFGEFVGDFKHHTLSDAKAFAQGGLIPVLVKAIQELEARLKTLEDA